MKRKLAVSATYFKSSLFVILMLLTINVSLASRVVVGIGVNAQPYPAYPTYPAYAAPYPTTEWVPGHWYYGRWIPGHYVEYAPPSPGPAFIWYQGGWDGYGHWHRGYWGHRHHH